MSTFALFTNELEADKLLEDAEDPRVRNLTTLCIVTLRMRAMRRAGEAEGDWRARLPSAPIDLAFVCAGLLEAFSSVAVVEQVLKGESLAAATGWDV
jgi:hypothetical protein